MKFKSSTRVRLEGDTGYRKRDCWVVSSRLWPHQARPRSRISRRYPLGTRTRNLERVRVRHIKNRDVRIRVRSAIRKIRDVRLRIRFAKRKSQSGHGHKHEHVFQNINFICEM
jgi:hypothetical protein